MELVKIKGPVELDQIRSEFDYVYAFDEIYVCISDSKSSGTSNYEILESYSTNNSIQFVVQKGGAFEMENSDISILVNLGRYLFVEVTEDARSHLSGHNDVCWEIESLVEYKSMYTKVPQIDLSGRAAERFADLSFEIDKQRLKTHMERLCSNETRFTFTESYTEAGIYCEDHLMGLGYEVTRQPFKIASQANRETFNVIATKKGMSDSSSVVIACAHLDSINRNGQDLTAPGADDNASGSTGVLEIASQLACFDFTHDLILILFGGEELGLHGSLKYVETISNTTNILAVINMDMVARKNDPQHGVLVEGHQVSEDLVKQIAEVAASVTDMEVKVSHQPYASDHIPFIRKGYPAVLTIEGSDSSNVDIHTENDTLDVIDYELMAKILKVNTIVINEVLIPT